MRRTYDREILLKERMIDMAVYSTGIILKQCRKAKGITQEELCSGICTPGALSQMENSKMEPSYVKFASMMERMGEWPEAYDVFIGDKVYRIHELEREIQKCAYHHEYEEMGFYLNEYGREISLSPSETIYLQFYEFMSVVNREKGRINKEQINELEDILRMTVRAYGIQPLKNLFLSYQELQILNCIALGYGESNQREKAIELLDELKEYMDKRFMGSREKLSIYSPVLLNQVKYLGLDGKYEEALRCAKQSIDLLIETGSTLFIAELYYDIAWIYTRMDKKKFFNQIKENMLISIYTDISNCQYCSAVQSVEFVKNNVQELLDDISWSQCEALCRKLAQSHSQTQKC